MWVCSPSGPPRCACISGCPGLRSRGFLRAWTKLMTVGHQGAVGPTTQSCFPGHLGPPQGQAQEASGPSPGEVGPQHRATSSLWGASCRFRGRGPPGLGAQASAARGGLGLDSGAARGCGLGRVTAAQVHGVATSRVSDRPCREEGTLGPRTPATAPRSCSPGSNQLWVGGRRASARARCCPRACNEPLHQHRPRSRPQSHCPRFPGLQEGGGRGPEGAGGRARRPTVLFLSF